MTGTFDPLWDNWKKYADAYAGGKFRVYALTESMMRSHIPRALKLYGYWFNPDFKVFGSAELDGQIITFAALNAEGHEAAFKRFVRMARLTANELPASIVDSMQLSRATAPPAKWATAMWLKSPPQVGLWFGRPTKSRTLDFADAGWSWTEPFREAAHTLERLGLVDAMPKSGEQWSRPMSLAEIAAIVLNKPKTRSRDIEKLIASGWLKLKAHGKLWMVKLDKNIPPEMRKRFETQ